MPFLFCLRHEAQFGKMLARALFKSVTRRMGTKTANNISVNIARRYTTQKVKSVLGFGRSAFLAGLGVGVGALLFAPRSFAEDRVIQELQRTEEEPEGAVFERAGTFRADLPVFSREEISKHNTLETRIWVTYKEGVYDITEFIDLHPGRDKILMAAGRAIDPFWSMYQQHKTDQVAEMLEEYRIGNLSKEDAAKIQSEMASDPYALDPTRNPLLIRRALKPFNAETPAELLSQNLVTPNDLFYIRNHLPVPYIEESKYALTITSESLEKPIVLTLDDLRNKFKQHSVMAAIQCAGNRRDDFNKQKEVKGLTWDVGAIGNAVWSGPKLRDILMWAGVDPESPELMHVHFEGLDKDFEKNYAASIPIDKAMSPAGDVILALQMNGEEIPIDHGFPVRAVVPGVVGARNVKWLGKVHVSKDESKGHWQQLDYKGFSPDADWRSLDFNSAPAIQELPVQSAITHIKPESDVISIKGYAWSGGGRGIVRVDVSTDGGKTWQVAELEKPNQRPGRVWGWTLWTLNIPLEQMKDKEQLSIVAKAIDESYNVQPDGTPGLWNLRGVLNNAWHKREVK